MSVRQLTKTFPIIEVFGPVVQGEGPLAGQVTHFVRLGLCDYRCSWCDTMYAVEPAEVKLNATQMTVNAILDRLGELDHLAPWVTLSGGNPAIHDLAELTASIQFLSMRVAVETQGSRWRTWLRDVDMLIVSPKPPSSDMATTPRIKQNARFMDEATVQVSPQQRAIKIVVFDEADLWWADQFMMDHPWPLKYLSVGTDVPVYGETLEETRRKVCERYQWLTEKVPFMASDVIVLPQLHVLAYGHQRGV